MQAAIDLDAVFRLVEAKQDVTAEFEQTWCGWYDENGILHENWFILALNECLHQNKIVFVLLYLYNYCIYDIESTKDFDKNSHETLNHSTALIFFPKNKTEYDVFYFNSHGNFQLHTHTYDLYVTRKRSKEIPVPKEGQDVHVDGFIISNLVKMFNSEISNYTDQYCKLNYDLSNKHNYYGTNLQCVDPNGFCYMFPFLIWYELTTNLYESNKFDDVSYRVTRNSGHSQKSYRFNSYHSYLCKNEFTHVIFLMMSKYFPVVQEMYLKHTTQSFTNPLVPKRMRSQNILHPYTGVFEYQDVFYEIMESALRFNGAEQFHRIINNIVDYITQAEITMHCDQIISTVAA